MARPPVFPAEEKVRIVLSILAGEITVAKAARRAKVLGQLGDLGFELLLPDGRPRLARGQACLPRLRGTVVSSSRLTARTGPR